MALGPNQLSQFQYLLAKAVDLNFRETRSDVVEVYPEFTTPGDTRNADFRSTTTVGLGPFQYTTEFGQFHKDAWEPGTERTSTWVKFTNGFVVSEELQEDMEKNERVYEDKVEMLSNTNQELKDTWAWTKETIAILFLTSCTSTTQTTSWPGAGRDGLALASASHTSIKVPVVTVSNLQTASTLSQLAIQEGISMLQNQVNDEGRPQGPVDEVILLYGRWWEWRVAEIFGTEKQVDSANNNINPLVAKSSSKRVRVTPVCNPYLPTNSTRFAFITKKAMLKFFEATKVKLAKEKDTSTGALIFKAMARAGIDHLSWRGTNFNLGL